MIPRIVNGIPTDIDVTALIKAFGVPEIGVSIDYDRVSKVIKTPKAAPRFRTVTNQWRKKLMRDHSLFMLCRDGAFVAASEGEKCELSGAKHQRGIRSIKVSATIDRDYIDTTALSDEHKKALTHRQMANATILGAVSQLRRKKSPELPLGVGGAK